MNFVDAQTSPGGMKMEAQLLDFMQSALSSTILGLAQTLGGDDVILTGVEITSGNASDGWILYNGEVFKFNGGAVQSTFLITNTSVSTSNEDGTSVPRYYTREASFGTGVGQINFSLLKRIDSLKDLLHASNVALAFGQNGSAGDWVVLTGCTPNAGFTQITSGLAMYDDRVIEIPSYTPGGTISSGAPAYYDGINGEWSNSVVAGAIKFEPYTPDRIERFARNAQHPIGAILWFKSGESFLTDKFDSGDGLGEWDGWAIADGANGTLDLSSAISGLVAVQRVL